RPHRRHSGEQQRGKRNKASAAGNGIQRSAQNSGGKQEHGLGQSQRTVLYHERARYRSLANFVEQHTPLAHFGGESCFVRQACSSVAPVESGLTLGTRTRSAGTLYRRPAE